MGWWKLYEVATPGPEIIAFSCISRYITVNQCILKRGENRSVLTNFVKRYFLH